MLKRGLVLGLVLALTLTGCGRGEDKLLSYIGDYDVGMVNSKEEAEALYASLDKISDMEWTYDRERIEGLIQLKEVLERETQERSFTLNEESTSHTSAVKAWKSHMDQGQDPKEETAKNLYFYISGKKSKEMRQLCELIEEMGYPEVSQCCEGKDVISRGMLFEMMENTDEKGDIVYDLYINVPNSLVYYPVKCKDMLDLVVENGFYPESNVSMGGALNMISFYRDTDDTLCKFVKCYFDHTGKLVEFDACMADTGIAKVETEEEKTLLTELVTCLTGERNGAVSFVNQLSRKGKGNREGSIGDYDWSISWSNSECYVLQIQ